MVLLSNAQLSFSFFLFHFLSPLLLNNKSIIILYKCDDSSCIVSIQCTICTSYSLQVLFACIVSLLTAAKINILWQVALEIHLNKYATDFRLHTEMKPTKHMQKCVIHEKHLLHTLYFEHIIALTRSTICIIPFSRPPNMFALICDFNRIFLCCFLFPTKSLT